MKVVRPHVMTIEVEKQFPYRPLSHEIRSLSWNQSWIATHHPELRMQRAQQPDTRNDPDRHCAVFLYNQARPCLNTECRRNL